MSKPIELQFYEVEMQVVVRYFADGFDKGITLDRWYYDPSKQMLVLRLYKEVK